jgi:hypothetical protein
VVEWFFLVFFLLQPICETLVLGLGIMFYSIGCPTVISDVHVGIKSPPLKLEAVAMLLVI